MCFGAWGHSGGGATGSRGAEQDLRALRRFLLQADLITSLFPKPLGAFCCNTLSHADGRDTTRLRAHDTARGANAAVDSIVEDKLWDLSCFSAPGLSTDDDNTAAPKNGHQTGIDGINQSE